MDSVQWYNKCVQYNMYISNLPTKIQATTTNCCCWGLAVDIGILEKSDFICCTVYSKLLLLLLLTHVLSALLALLQLIIVLSTFNNCINYLCKPLMLPFINLLISLTKLFCFGSTVILQFLLVCSSLFSWGYACSLNEKNYLAKTLQLF